MNSHSCKKNSNDSFPFVAKRFRVAVPLFAIGKSANPWEDQLLDQAAGTAFRAKWSTALVPGKNGSISDLGGNDLVMFKASKNKENAFKLMAFLTSPEIE